MLLWLFVFLASAGYAQADSYAATASSTASSTGSVSTGYSSDNDRLAPAFKQTLLNSLPASVSDGLDIDAWGWFNDLHTDHRTDNNYWDGEFSLAVTKNFDQRVTLSAQANFIDASNTTRVEL
jgi:hypothetical protein